MLCICSAVIQTGDMLHSTEGPHSSDLLKKSSVIIVLLIQLLRTRFCAFWRFVSQKIEFHHLAMKSEALTCNSWVTVAELRCLQLTNVDFPDSTPYQLLAGTSSLEKFLEIWTYERIFLLIFVYTTFPVAVRVAWGIIDVYPLILR